MRVPRSLYCEYFSIFSPQAKLTATQKGVEKERGFEGLLQPAMETEEKLRCNVLIHGDLSKAVHFGNAAVGLLRGSTALCQGAARLGHEKERATFDCLLLTILNDAPQVQARDENSHRGHGLLMLD